MAKPPTRRSRSDDEEEARYWAEDEAARAEDEEKAQLAAEEEAADRESAIEMMTRWFEENFEDPQNQTPIDSEEGGYIYINGGPFDAGDMIGSQFADDFEQEWIDAAVEQVTSDGTFEWAPTPGGGFYDGQDQGEDTIDENVVGSTISTNGHVEIDLFPSDPATERADTISRISDRLERIEAQLSILWTASPPSGHNQPPDEIGLPPYDGEDRRELEQAIAITREQIASQEPDGLKLEIAESTFRRVSASILKWLGRKADLAVDETIKASVGVAKWSTVAALASGLAADLARLLSYILPF